MTMQGDAKRNAKLTHGLKNVSKNLVNFLASSRKSENLHFDGLLLYKAYKVFVEKVQKIYVSWQWRVTQSLKKNWLLVNFTASNGKPENLHFDVLLLSKVYHVWAKKKQRSYVTGHWRKMQNLNNELCFEKWHYKFDKFWPNTRKSQNLHFNGLLLTKV